MDFGVIHQSNELIGQVPQRLMGVKGKDDVGLFIIARSLTPKGKFGGNLGVLLSISLFQMLGFA